MPNNQIDPQLHQALANAFGGSQTPPAQQPSAPAPAAPADSGAGSSLFSALFGNSQPQQPQVDPYQNFANKATGRDYK